MPIGKRRRRPRVRPLTHFREIGGGNWARSMDDFEFHQSFVQHFLKIQ